MVKTKYFIGGTYEKEIINGTTERNLYYISASNGLVAIYEKIGSNTAMHYVFKDNLGSYNVITDASGNIEENLSFDAWGRRRNATDWTFDNMPTSFLFDRGFTGHEHLDEFGLINMNGRMYDPKVGAFLSPDIFANTSSTQGLNRYSYAMNNPLKYVDPSGYLVTGASGSGQNYDAINRQLQMSGLDWFTGMHKSNTISFNYADIGGRGWVAQSGTMSNEDFATFMKYASMMLARNIIAANNASMKDLNKYQKDHKNNQNDISNVTACLNGYCGPASPANGTGDPDPNTLHEYSVPEIPGLTVVDYNVSEPSNSDSRQYGLYIQLSYSYGDLTFSLPNPQWYQEKSHDNGLTFTRDCQPNCCPYYCQLPSSVLETNIDMDDGPNWWDEKRPWSGFLLLYSDPTPPANLTDRPSGDIVFALSYGYYVKDGITILLPFKVEINHTH